MPKLTKRTIVACKTETTQNSAAAVAATDYFYAEDLTVEPVFEMNEREYAKASLGALAAVPGEKLYRVSFKTELKGSGTAGTPYAPIGAILQSAGMSETVSGGVSVTYAPISTTVANFYGPGKSMTIHANYDGLRHQVVGVMGTYKLSLQAGKICMLEYSGMGVYATPSDVTFPTQTYSSVTGVPVRSSSFTIQSYSAIIGKLDIDAGVQVVKRPDVSSPTAILGFMVAGRKYVGAIDPEHELQATHNWWILMENGSVGSSSIILGSTAGNIITFTMPKTQYVAQKYGDRSGVRSHDITLRFNENSGDDEISIVFT